MARHIGNTLTLAALLAAASPAFAQDQQQRLDDPDWAAYRPDLPRAAEISIYNGPKWPCVPHSGDPTTELYVGVNTCLSANFTLDNNVHLAYSGLCAGWTRHPYIAFYPTADCTGEYSHPSGWSGAGPGHCLSKALWRDITPPVGQWSMSLRCDDAEALETVEIGLPELPKKVEPKPVPRPAAASVSNSACYIPGMRGIPKFLFQRPEADVCVNMEAKHRLTIYRNALCPDGTEALFARFDGRGCKRSPVVLKEVGADMIHTKGQDSCIEMGGEEESSYAFWCTGKLQEKTMEDDLFPEEGGTRVHYSYGNRPQEARVRSDGVSGGISGGAALMVLVVWVILLE